MKIGNRVLKLTEPEGLQSTYIQAKKSERYILANCEVMKEIAHDRYSKISC